MKNKIAPVVSVIMAVHNEEKFIGRCIRSVINQTYPRSDFEIIVVNDGSTDRTAFALDLFEEELRIFHNEKQQGLPASLNTGIKHARGRFVVRLDGDDYVHSEYLNVLSLHLALNGKLDAVGCDYQLVDDEENVLSIMNCDENPIGCGIMFRVEQLIELGMYDEDFLMHEDLDLRIRFEERYRIHRVALPLYRYRRNEHNMTNHVERGRTFIEALKDKHGPAKLRGLVENG